jgi:ArsR family transcriptional regulator
MSEQACIKLTSEERRLVAMFKALGNPVRLAILKQLAECRRCNCGEIVATLPLAQSPVSQHLKVLKEVGLIRGEIEGPATCYCLDAEGMTWLMRTVGERFPALCCEIIGEGAGGGTTCGTCR